MQARVAPRLILLLSAICATANPGAAEQYVPPTADGFLKSIKSYPYVASAARREKIRVGVPQMTRCMPSQEVRKLLGNPDFGYLGYKGDVVSQRIWHYILEKQARVETVPSSSVVVWFDRNGKVQTVAVHGATDIEAAISRRNQECP